MAMLPALVTSLVLAGTPAMRYSSQLRVETFLRAPNLTERDDRAVIEDVIITPRGQVIYYTPRMELKAILEPQLMMRRSFTEPTLEVLTFLYLRGEYQLTRGLKVWAVESLTFGSFPFEDFKIREPINAEEEDGRRRLLDATQYMYSESMAGFHFTGLRRTYIGANVGFIFNGLLDAPVLVRPRGDRATPSQQGPEARLTAIHALTRRLALGVNMWGRDVHFSTQARVSLLQGAPLVQYQFHPQIQGQLELGLAVGERRPQLTALPHPNRSILHPVGEASLSTPVPVGYHWPVQAKLTARYVPFVNLFSTDTYPRMEGAFGFEWKGRRKAQVNVELAVAQAATDGFHRRDGEERLTAKVQWPLTRSSAFVASGRLLRLREFLIDDDPLYKWFMGVGLVIRQENGRL